MITVRTSTQLPAGTMAVPAARRFTSDVLHGWQVTAGTREIVELVVSELVGNAVQHGDGIAAFGLAMGADVIRIEVVDSSSDLPVLFSPEPVGDRHRGLLIVAAVSTRWGTRREAGGGKTVWAELPRAAGDRTVEITTTDISPRTTQEVSASVTEIVTGPTLRATTAERSPTG
ncbi:MAG TPA: ATP-binding protein [Pseudonocardiaceae bacterium]|nr:ATP-binding protein [Pseudonocardiaceae bacterium]